LLRWIHDLGSRDFGLDELAVVTAMVGDEWEETCQDVTTDNSGYSTMRNTV
jgi:hypothetical protein